MNIVSLFLITLASTTAMTLFSYGFSCLVHQNLVEPYWLNRLLFKRYGWQSPYGWITHYITGIGFLYLIDLLRNYFSFPLYLEIVIFGGLEGGLGILMWILLFWFSKPSETFDRQRYYLNLLIAHILFAATALALLGVTIATL